MLASIKKVKNKYDVKFNLTEGEMLALENALREYALKSPVGADVFNYLCNAQKRIAAVPNKA